MIELICWLLPPSLLKNRLLRRFGHTIAASARIGPTVAVNLRRAEIGERVTFGMFNVLRGLSLVRFDDDAALESWNWISAHPAYQEIDPAAGTLALGYGAKIGSRCYLDCSGTIVVGPFGALGGNRVFVQTHGPDFEKNIQRVGRVVVGHHALVASCAVMLMGAKLPPQSLLAANSTMTGPVSARRGLYAGSPATWKRDTPGEWFQRAETYTSDNIIHEPMGLLDGDLDLPEDHPELGSIRLS